MISRFFFQGIDFLSDKYLNLGPVFRGIIKNQSIPSLASEMAKFKTKYLNQTEGDFIYNPHNGTYSGQRVIDDSPFFYDHYFIWESITGPTLTYDEWKTIVSEWNIITLPPLIILGIGILFFLFIYMPVYTSSYCHSIRRRHKGAPYLFNITLICLGCILLFIISISIGYYRISTTFETFKNLPDYIPDITESLFRPIEESVKNFSLYSKGPLKNITEQLMNDKQIVDEKFTSVDNKINIVKEKVSNSLASVKNGLNQQMEALKTVLRKNDDTKSFADELVTLTDEDTKKNMMDSVNSVADFKSTFSGVTEFWEYANGLVNVVKRYTNSDTIIIGETPLSYFIKLSKEHKYSSMSLFSDILKFKVIKISVAVFWTMFALFIVIGAGTYLVLLSNRLFYRVIARVLPMVAIPVNLAFIVTTSLLLFIWSIILCLGYTFNDSIREGVNGLFYELINRDTYINGVDFSKLTKDYIGTEMKIPIIQFNDFDNDTFSNFLAAPLDSSLYKTLKIEKFFKAPSNISFAESIKEYAEGFNKTKNSKYFLTSTLNGLESCSKDEMSYAYNYNIAETLNKIEDKLKVQSNTEIRNALDSFYSVYKNNELKTQYNELTEELKSLDDTIMNHVKKSTFAISKLADTAFNGIRNTLDIAETKVFSGFFILFWNKIVLYLRVGVIFLLLSSAMATCVLFILVLILVTRNRDLQNEEVDIVKAKLELRAKKERHRRNLVDDEKNLLIDFNLRNKL